MAGAVAGLWMETLDLVQLHCLPSPVYDDGEGPARLRPLDRQVLRRQTFPTDDHRNFNREGQAFDVGETFAGVDFATGVEAATLLADLPRGDATFAQFVIRWIIMFEQVSTVIPGAKNERQGRENAVAATLPPLDEDTMRRVRDVYESHVAALVQDRW